MTNTLPPAHWAVDPLGRHEHRYWDGTRWTDHVSDRGAVAVDPIEGAVATTPQDAAAPSPVNRDGLLVPVVEAPPPPPPAAGTAFLPTTDLRLGKPSYWRSVDGPKAALVVLLVCSALTAIAQFATLINRISAIDDFQRSFTFAETASSASLTRCASAKVKLRWKSSIALMRLISVANCAIAVSALQTSTTTSAALGPSTERQ